MKKVFFHAVMAAAAIVAAISCDKHTVSGFEPAVPDGYYLEVVKAVCPSSTKVSVDDITGKVGWVEGDFVAFHLSDGTYLTAPVDPSTGEVSLVIPEGVVRDGYAVYPASIAVADHAEGGDVRVRLPDLYDVSDNLGGGNVPVPMIAVNDASSERVSFTHLGGLMQVNFTAPSGVSWVTVSVGGGISGEFLVSEGDAPSISKGSSATTVTFRLSEGLVTDPQPVKLMVPVPVGSYSSLSMNLGFGTQTTATLSRNVSLDFVRAQGKKVNVASTSFSSKLFSPFYLQALEDSEVWVTCRGSVTDAQVYYSTDDKVTWQKLGSSHVSLSQGTKAFFVGLRSSVSESADDGFSIGGSGKMKAGGRLIFLTSAVSSISDYHFYGLFKDNEGLAEANVITFPTNPVKPWSYAHMFDGCTALTKTGILPGSSGNPAAYCYSAMYRGCSSLATAPKLPFTTLAEGCYEYLFENCTGLTAAPELMAPYGAKYCYRGMFSGCSNLSEIICALQSWAANADPSEDDYGSTLDWVKGVAVSGRFIGPKALDMTIQSDSHVPVGWNAFYDDSLDIQM